MLPFTPRLFSAKRVFTLAITAALAATWGAARLQAQTCGNPIACENALTGNLASEWDIPGIGDPTIQGYATDFSVNRGQTVNFKIDTDATAYRIDIYRLGYYGGRGARKVATISPTASLPQSQPQCLRDGTTGLVDCGNWATSASWPVPSTGVSGVYIAKLIRTDTGGASHIVFVVRNDTSQSDLLFQTSDLTWQAYNDYGGSNLYAVPPVNGPGPGGRGYKVSYNRPFSTRVNGRFEVSFLFWAEYPMIRWLEANGYNVSYASGIDTDRRGSAALNTHKVFLSVGHDEYWSSGQRANVEAARAFGVHLAFISGNEVYWKTRWENSIDGTNTPYRTLVCYKETEVGAKVDPAPIWTGTWRDPRFPQYDGGRPENALTGQLFTVGSWRQDPVVISQTEGKLRFWRNTGLDTLALGQTALLPAGVLGIEWDEIVDNGFLPPGLIRMSTTTLPVELRLQDYGFVYGPGIATHSLSLYRHSSGALVFGAGTMQWSWGLDANHDFRSDHLLPPTDVRMQQATVNLFADMTVQPGTLQPGLVGASPPANTIAPTSAILTPLGGATVSMCSPVTISGTASANGGGLPAAVEFSTDGGATWHRASGAGAWTAIWIPAAAGATILKSRAVNENGWIESPGPGIPITVVSVACPLATNVALASAGGVASASSIYDTNYPASAINDNERAGVNAGSGGMWADNTGNIFPDWAQVDFSGSRAIDRVVLYTLQDNVGSPIEPSDTTTFSLYGVVDFTVQAWDGTTWVTLATVSGNNLVKRTVTFPRFITNRIRVNVTNALTTFSRIVELEAWGFALEAAAPIFTPPSGTYSSPVSVTLSSATPGAQIYYTTNGTIPTTSSSRYTGPVTLNVNTPINAIAVAAGSSNSPMASATYTIQQSQTATPTFTPGAGTYSVNQSVTISDVTPGAVIYYTTNGTTPTTSSTRYTGPIVVSTPTTLKAMATATGLTNSSVASAAYAFQAAPPTFNPAGGTYTAAQSVTLSDISQGAAIYYTTNGTTPTTASPRYTAPIAIGVTTTINAIAAVGGWSTSGVANATYTIQLPSPPRPPTGLTANAVSASQVDLAWSDVATDETGFKIERKTGSGGTYAQIATVGANVTTFSDTTAGASTTYYYRLRATNAAGDSSYSNEANATTPSPSGPPAPWTQAEIGSLGIPGNATFLNGTFTVQGSGADIWNTADAFHFVSQSLTGNGEIVARVVSVQGTDPWAKAGVMIRETTASNARNAMMAVSSGNGLTFQRRLSAGGASTYNGVAAITAPYWVRLVRSGNTFTGYASTNGVAWTQIGTDTISMANTVLIGLAVTAHNNAALNTSVFDNVAVGTQLTAPSSLTATTASSSQINLSWVDNSTGETGFKIERKTGAAGTYAQIATVAADVTTYSDASLTSDTTYFYRVRATNAIGDSAYSVEASATTAVSPPAVPTGLTATTASSTQINLAWNDVANETGYKIERKTGAGGTYAQIATVGAGVVSYNNTGLTVNTAYFYRVRASNAGGDSGYSAEANATTLNTAPAAPSGLVATPVSATQIDLSWVDNSTNETGFRIERSVGGNFVEITTVAAGVSTFSDTGLTSGTTYSYRVRATNALGDSAYSNTASAATLVLPPAAPATLNAAAVSSSQINITWANVANETGYKIERKTGAAGTYAQIATVGVNVTTYSDTGLGSSTSYYYRVRAINSGGDSAYSPEANATTLNAVPPAPVGLTATVISSTQINLSWTDVANETGFKIERKTGASGTYAQIATVGANVTTYNNTGLTAGTTYFYRIRASSAVGDSPYSAEVSAVTSSALPPAPSSLAATSVSSSQINLSWVDVANETGYKIERKTGAGGTYAQIATVSANVISYSNTGLTAGTTYFYRIRATNAAGDSGYSSEVSATTSIPAFRAAASAGATSGVISLTINKPAGTQTGDVMVASIAVRPNTTAITPVAGWTLIRRIDNSNSNANSLSVYYKVAGASEPVSYNWTFNTSAGSAGGIQTFSGVDSVNPVDVDAGQNTANALTHTAPSVTTRFANDMIVTSHAFSSSATFTAPSGMIEGFDAKSDSIAAGGEAVEGNYRLQSGVAATGTMTATASNDADVGNAHTLALKAR